MLDNVTSYVNLIYVITALRMDVLDNCRIYMPSINVIQQNYYILKLEISGGMSINTEQTTMIIRKLL